MKILNFGSLNLDYVYEVDHFVQPGETLSAASQTVKAGGKGLNQSIAVTRPGWPILFPTKMKWTQEEAFNERSGIAAIAQ